MRAKNRWPQAVVVFGLFVLTVVFLVGPGKKGAPDDPLAAIETPSRLLEGRIVADGAPVAAARLELREGTEAVARAVSGADGSYAITWRPRTTTDIGKLWLLVRHEEFAPTIDVPARTFELAAPIAVEGIVLTPAGQPRDGVRVSIGSHGFVYGTVESAGDGTFEVAGVPRGAELEAFVEGGGVAPVVFRGFRAGERMVLHAQSGRRVDVRVHDPSGLAVQGSTVRVAAADGFSSEEHAGERVSLVAAAGSSAFVVAAAPGHLPVFLDAHGFGATEAVLWPERVVTLRVWDAVRRRGVFGIELEVSLAPGGANQNWNGPNAGRSFREFFLRMGERRGEYTVRLPQAPVRLRVSADGYGDREVELDAEETEVTVRMRPLHEAPSATLRVTCEKELWLVVADEQEPWFTAFRAPGEVTVPADRKLELASAGAEDGAWLPPIPVQPIARGRVRTLAAPLRPAAELIVKIEPTVTCDVEVVDPSFGPAVPPARQRAVDEARFWVRPSRTVQVKVRPLGNWQGLDAEFAVEPRRREWLASLQEAAGLRLRLVDGAGYPVPFARVRYWEAGPGGRLELRRGPERVLTDAYGVAMLVGLRRGPTPIEIEADGFRTLRPPTPALEEGPLLDLGTFTMNPAGIVRGTVLDPDGQPLSGVFVRTLGPSFGRVALPDGGERNVYDLLDEENGDAISNESGAFELRDSVPRLPMLVAQANGRRDIATFAAPANEGMVVRMPAAAHVELPVRGHVNGIYMLLPGNDALRVYAPGPIRLNPIPLTLPAGRVVLFVDYRYGRPAPPAEFDLVPGDQKIRLPQ